MSNVDFSKEFDALVQKYAELLTGQSSSDIRAQSGYGPEIISKDSVTSILSFTD